MGEADRSTWVDVGGLLVAEEGPWELYDEFPILPGYGEWIHPDQIRDETKRLRPVEPRPLTILTSPIGIDNWLAVPNWVRVMIWPEMVEVKERVSPVVQELIWQGYSKKDAKALVKSPPKTDKTGKLTALGEAYVEAQDWPELYQYQPPVFEIGQTLFPGVIPIAMDFETDAKWKFKAQMSGLALAGQEGSWWFNNEESAREAWESTVHQGKPVFHGGNYDLAIAKSRGWVIPEEYDDTLLMAFSAGEKTDDNERTLGLKVLSKKYLHRELREIKDFISDAEFKRSGTLNADPLALAQYAQEDARATLDLLPILREKKHTATYQLEMAIAPIVLSMDEAGFNADTSVLNQLSSWAGVGMERIEQWLKECVGWEGNLDSPTQVAVLLFDKLGLTSTFGRTTAKEAMEELRWHPVAKRVRAWRRLESLKAEAEGLLAQYIMDGKMHTTFFQYGGSTGRFSSGDPINLQNKRVTLRKAFVADDDREVVYAADYGQIELRIPATLANDTAMLKAINEGRSLHRDLHAHLTSMGINISYLDVKRFDFGVFYGADKVKIAEILGCSIERAEEIVDGLKRAWPEAMAWRDRVLKDTYDNGCFNTSMRGRPYYYPGLEDSDFTVRSHTERAAVNRVIQGTAADIMKLAIKGIPELHKKYGGKLRLTVHDEVVGTVPKESVVAFIADLRTVMLEAEPRVPLAVEIGYGKSWKEAKP